jgi:predicted nuclease of restriction endonuclease-like (RecB) superfamily
MPAIPSYPDYPVFLAGLKERILHARTSAVRAVNRELILLYWDIGRGIVEKQRKAGWGESVVERLAADLRGAFPDMRGFSARNVRDMKRFYLAYSDEAVWPQAVAKLSAGAEVPILQQSLAESGAKSKRPQAVANTSGCQTPSFLPQLVAEVPWGHHRFLLDKVVDPAARLYYLRATARFGWSRNVLLHQIKAQAYERAVLEKKTHNFPLALPEYLAGQADEMMKSSYNLEFLGITREIRERELEDRLIAHLQRFLLELGYGFTLGEKEYFIDLLFYHRFLKSLVAFELKIGPFEPEFAGKMDFYLNLLNDTERGPDDQPSIAVILCTEKDDVEVEYALRTKRNPIGVAEYRLLTKLPAELKGRLPTAKQLAEAVRAVLPDSRKTGQ